MELIFIVLGLALLATLLLPWINFFRLGTLSDDLERVIRDVRDLREDFISLRQLPQTSSPPVPVPKPVDTSPIQRAESKSPETEPEIEIVEEFGWDEVDTTVPASDTTSESPSRQTQIVSSSRFYGEDLKTDPKKAASFEFNIGAKLPVWIGAVSLAFAAFYLVKYSIEIGLLDPTVRIILGMVFGLGLLGSGRFIFQTPKIANNIRVGQGLVGAGIVSLTFALYSAVHIYHLILPLTGFIGMGAVVVTTMILSLRMGPPIALFGVIGGFLTPALFGTSEPNFIGLFSYLFVLYSGLQILMARQKWWGLSMATLAGALVWAFLSLLSHDIAAYGSVVIVFAVAISSVTLFISRPFWNDENINSKPHLLNFIALGGATVLMILLHSRVAFGIFEWSMTLLLSLAVAFLAYARQNVYRMALYAKMAADLTLFTIFTSQASVADAAMVGAGLAAIYVGLPYLVMRKVTLPAPWVVVQTVTALSLYLVAYLQYKGTLPFLPFDEVKGWGGVATIGAMASISQIPFWRQKGNDFAVAAYAATATAFLSGGMAIELPNSYLPAAFAAEVLALIWIYRYVPIAFTRKIAGGLLALVVALNTKPIATFVSQILSSIVHHPAKLTNEMMSMTYVMETYFIPSAFLAGAFYLYRRQKVVNPLIYQALLVLPLTGILAILYTLVQNHGFTLPSRSMVGATTFMERGIFTLIVAGFGFGLLHLPKPHPLLIVWGRSLLLLALARIVYFDSLIYNPMFDRTQYVGMLPLLNGVTMTFGTGLLISVYALKNKLGTSHTPSLETFYKFLTMAFLLAVITLNVRQVYHGPILAVGHSDNAELYTYSVAWLLSGIGLLTYGIRRFDRAVRMAAFALLALTICKVFLIDASNLEGLFRIFSFLGLGVSLIGLSVFYTRFMKHDEPSSPET